MKVGDIVVIIEPKNGFNDYVGKKGVISSTSSDKTCFCIYLYNEDSQIAWYDESELALIKEIEYI